MTAKNKFFQNLSKILLVPTIYFIMFLIMFFSKELSVGIKNGISVSMNLVIPSMFIFMIFSNIVINSRLKDLICQPFLFLGKYVFRISKEKLAIVLLSLVGGYPVGAKLISNSVSKGEMTKRQAENMLCYCVNCGPAFLISGVGVALFSSFKLGLYLYLSQIIACLFVGFIMSFFNKADIDEKASPATVAQIIPFSQLFVKAVNDAVRAMAVICGFIVAFSAILPIINLVLSNINTEFSCIIQGLLEVTTGCNSLSSISSNDKIILAAIFTSFGGICVHLQVLAMVSKSGSEKIKLTKFMLTRVIYTLVSVTATKIMLLASPDIVGCMSYNTSLNRDIYSVSPLATVFMILLAVMLLLFSRKSDNI